VLDVQNLTSTVQLLLSELQKQNLELQELRNHNEKQIQELKINNHNQIQELRQSHRVEIDQLSRDNQRHHQMTVQEFELVIIELRRNQRGDVLPFRRPRGEQMVDAPDWLSAEQQGSLEEKHAEQLFLPRRQPSPAPPTDDEDEEEVL
jgi:protein-tyrosine-phosphatase